MAIKLYDFTLCDTFNLSNPVGVAIKNIESRHSILTVKENVVVDHLFQFEHCQVSAILYQISELDGTKNDTSKNIPSSRLTTCQMFLLRI